MSKVVKPAGKTANGSRKLTMHGLGSERRAMNLAGDMRRLNGAEEKPKGGRRP